MLACYSGSRLVRAAHAGFTEQSLTLAKISDTLDYVINTHGELRPMSFWQCQSSSCSGKLPESSVIGRAIAVNVSLSLVGHAQMMLRRRVIFEAAAHCMFKPQRALQACRHELVYHHSVVYHHTGLPHNTHKVNCSVLVRESIHNTYYCNHNLSVSENTEKW